VLPVSLESTDGAPHRVRVRVETPRGFVPEGRPQTVDVPAHGRVNVDVGLLRGTAARGTPQGVVIVAEAVDGPLERMAVATAIVEIAPDPAWLPRLRAPLAVVAFVLLAAGIAAEVRRARGLRGGA